jgi:hypothetical protein
MSKVVIEIYTEADGSTVVTADGLGDDPLHRTFEQELGAAIVGGVQSLIDEVMKADKGLSGESLDTTQ